MEIHARQISVNGPHGTMLPPTSLRVAGGELTLVKGGREEATAFALAVTGRMATTTGAVLIDGEGDEVTLRTITAVVDSPEVSEPEPALPLTAVLAEELDHAGGDGGQATVTEWLRRLGAQNYANTRFEFVPATIRIRALLDIAATRPGVRMLVLDSPDRHSHDPNDWWPHALRHARDGLAVVVLCAHAMARLMGVDSATIGALEQPRPVGFAPEATTGTGNVAAPDGEGPDRQDPARQDSDGRDPDPHATGARHALTGHEPPAPLPGDTETIPAAEKESR